VLTKKTQTYRKLNQHDLLFWKLFWSKSKIDKSVMTFTLENDLLELPPLLLPEMGSINFRRAGAW